MKLYFRSFQLEAENFEFLSFFSFGHYILLHLRFIFLPAVFINFGHEKFRSFTSFFSAARIDRMLDYCGVGYAGAKYLKIPYMEAAPSTFIGASNFFELAVAVALILFGMESGAALATVVGVLVEVPVMLSLVKIMDRNREKFRF
jgi:hypothetical protein